MPHWKTKYNLIHFLILLLSILGLKANAQSLSQLGLPQVVPAESAFHFDLTAHENSLVATWHIAPSCYLYQKSLQITGLTLDGESFPLLPKTLPRANKIQDPFFGTQAIYKQLLEIHLQIPNHILNQKKRAFNIKVEYQGCAESGFCYPPTTKWFELTMANQHFISTPVTDPSQLVQENNVVSPKASFTMPKIPNLSQTLEKKFGIISAMATFYVIGLLLTFTPCVLPMIPILAGIIVGQAHLNTRKAFLLSLCYVLSMAFTYAFAGIMAATLGKNLQASLQSPFIIITFSALFALLGIMQLGVIRISILQHFRLKDFLHAIHAKQESGTYIGAVIMGILATLISSPCVTPALIGALSYISQTGNELLGGCVLLAMGLGMGTLLLVIGTLEGKFLPKSGPWMRHVNQVFAIMMFGVSLWLLDRVFHEAWLLILWGFLSLFIAWCMNTFNRKSGFSGRIGMIFVVLAAFLFWGAYKGEHQLVSVLSFQKQSSQMLITPYRIDSMQSLNNVQNKAIKQTQSLMLIFYADWCISCQRMEHGAFASNAVQTLLKDFVVVKADVTTYNKEAQALLKQFNLIGPPAILFFDKNGVELTKYRLIGEIPENEMITQLEALKRKL
ncbi:MAG: protein-disulfide reductase DsbD [Proteobacteria bacterium]|nr:protein-disulfide reductase DsbD [Pseudomonadota bacterium]